MCASSPQDGGTRRLTRSATGMGKQFAADLAVGALSSAVMSTAVYPVHRIKVVLQTQDSNPWVTSGRVQRFSFLPSWLRLYRQHGGILSLWRGCTPYVLRHMPNTSISFAVKDALQSLLPRHDPRAHFAKALASNVVSGSLAGAATTALLYPLDFMTIRMAADVGSAGRPQFGHTMRAVWQDTAVRHGVLSMYRGFGTAVASIAAYRGLYFGIFDSVKPLVFEQRLSEQQSKPPSFWLKWATAQLCVWTAVTLTYPLDILRKRMVIDGGAGDAQPRPALGQLARQIWRREGIRGFYRFWLVDMAFRCGGGLLLVVYDELKVIID